jgi:hypothetical protein
MNKQRRKDLERARDLLGEARTIIETARDEEQDYVDNMPESMQGGEKGSAAEGNVQCLDDALDAIDEVVDTHIAGAVGAA